MIGLGVGDRSGQDVTQKDRSDFVHSYFFYKRVVKVT